MNAQLTTITTNTLGHIMLLSWCVSNQLWCVFVRRILLSSLIMQWVHGRLSFKCNTSCHSLLYLQKTVCTPSLIGKNRFIALLIVGKRLKKQNQIWKHLSFLNVSFLPHWENYWKMDLELFSSTTAAEDFCPETNNKVFCITVNLQLYDRG